jgi:GDP-L-fucose synthase
MKIVITGGSGMVGNTIKNLINGSQCLDRKYFETLSFYNKNIIHLAARVGGVKANTNFISDFYTDNNIINQKVLLKAFSDKAKKVVSLLSTCVYPDEPFVTYPLTEDQLHNGPPHSSNFGYAYAKRMLDVQSRAYRQQYGCNFITAIPNNLYGESDNFDLENSHVIPALIRKIYEAKLNNFSEVEVWGDGSCLREFTYSLDIAKILLFLLENYNEPDPINIGNTKEYSIKEVVKLLCKILEYDGKIFWNNDKPSGQFRKPSSNQKLLNFGWKESDYTPLEEGLKKTCEWFKINYPNIRGIK